MGLFVLLMGAQGVGKGEQAKFIKQTYNIPHISTGDIFRGMRTREDDLAKQVQALMNAGQLISDEITNAVVADRLSQPDTDNGAILDGYPRTPVQAQFLEQFLAKKGEVLKAVILLELDLFTAFKRAFGRVTAQNGDSYNIFYRHEGLDIAYEKYPADQYPPKIVATVKATGEVLKRRADDADANAVITRLETYIRETQPLIDFYSQKGDLLKRLDANQSIETVSTQIKALLDGAM